MAEGSKNRKIGRSKRKPTDQAYKSLDRGAKNKARNIASQARWQKFVAKVIAIWREAHPDGPRPRDVSRRVRKLRASHRSS